LASYDIVGSIANKWAELKLGRSERKISPCSQTFERIETLIFGLYLHWQNIKPKADQLLSRRPGNLINKNSV